MHSQHESEVGYTSDSSKVEQISASLVAKARFLALECLDVGNSKRHY